MLEGFMHYNKENTSLTTFYKVIVHQLNGPTLDYFLMNSFPELH